MIRHIIPIAALLLAACDGPAPEGPLQVSVIGSPAKLAAIGKDEPSAPQAALLASAAQGLVSFDGAGQLEPGLAQRWIVSDDGLSYIFRLRRTEWRIGKPVTADDLARMLRKMMAANSGHRLAAYFSAVEEIDPVTPEILEIRLRAPRPHFLALLAAPEMALLSRGQGTGPFRIASRSGAAFALDPVVDPAMPDEAQAREPVTLTAHRAALALVRYRNNRSEAVLGGSFADLPVARALDPPAGQLRFDPAVGLFGLAVTAKAGFLASADNRDAVAMAIDRTALVGLFGVPGWRPVLSIVPARLDMTGDPALPEWAAQSLEDRVDVARARVDAWRDNNEGGPRLRVALPDGPGARLLFAQLTVDLARIGIVAERVGLRAPADLRLIDAVAPNDSATWYLTRLSCAQGLPCGETGEASLKASRTAPSLAVRALLLKQADDAFVTNMPFIPLASPLRWSLVKPRLRGFRPNARATHPLHRLLRE